MIIKIASLAAVLLLTAASGRAGAPNPANPVNASNAPQQYDPASQSAPSSMKQAAADFEASYKKTQACFVVENALKADYAQKQSEITAEFHGRVPPALAELLWQKSERISRQHKTCFQEYETTGKLLDQARGALRFVDFTKPDYKKYKDILDQAADKLSKIQPTPPRAASPGKKKGAN